MSKRSFRRATWLALLSVTTGVVVLQSAATQESAAARDVRATYAKQEVMIPMRDGVEAVHHHLRAEGHVAEATRSC